MEEIWGRERGERGEREGREGRGRRGEGGGVEEREREGLVGEEGT